MTWIFIFGAFSVVLHILQVFIFYVGVFLGAVGFIAQSKDMKVR